MDDNQMTMFEGPEISGGPMSDAPAADREAPATDTPSAPDILQELDRVVIREMSKKEDATDAINELRDRQAIRDGDPKANDPYRQAERYERHKEILSKLSKAMADAEKRDPAAIESRIRDEREMAAASVRLENYEAKNRGFCTAIEQAVAEYGDISREAARAIWRSPHGPEIIDHIYARPELVAGINQLPPEELGKFVAGMEGGLATNAPWTRWASPRGVAPQPSLPPAKTVSTAPKPHTTLTGSHTGSLAPNLHELAKQEDATAFIEESRRRERARRR